MAGNGPEVATSTEIPVKHVIRPLRLLQDAIIHLVLAVLIIILRYCTEPFQQIFYCHDDSIRYPYMPDIVSNTALMTTAVVVPLTSIIVVETVRSRKKKKRSQTPAVLGDVTTFSIQISPADAPVQDTYVRARAIHPLIYQIVRHGNTFFFGVLATVILTFIGKLTLGELRPHFLDVCQPSWTHKDCLNYQSFDASICQGDPVALKEARQSFPSGHASIAAYVAAFTILYLQKRVQRPLSPNASRLIIPALQFVLVALALFVGLSRVADNHHHLTDVACGWALGTAVAAAVSYHFGLLGRR